MTAQLAKRGVLLGVGPVCLHTYTYREPALVLSDGGFKFWTLEMNFFYLSV